MKMSSFVFETHGN